VNRRRFLLGSAGASAAVLGGPWLATATAAPEDDLAFANFGISTEYLLSDFYGRALASKQFHGPAVRVLRQGKTAAQKHTRALGRLIAGAGDSAPLAADFEFGWPASAFASETGTVTTGLTVLRALLGSYQTAAAQATVPEYRVLFASLVASTSQQLGAIASFAAPTGAEPFPLALDVETASSQLERYLG
jgi:hypothetical protein